MITDEMREFMRRDIFKGLMSLGLFSLALSRANFGTAEPSVFPDVDPSPTQLMQHSNDVKTQELWESIFSMSDNTAGCLCALSSALLLIMTLLKGQDKSKQALIIFIMVCLGLAGLAIVVSDLASWASGVRFKMLSSGCYLSLISSIYTFNYLRFLSIYLCFQVILILQKELSRW